tara:strand:- start:6 stop:194 length:189 start_codon:yes stop_codon:yes gene_type:complete
MEITKEQFLAFVRVQRGGLTNMWDARNVESLSGGVVDRAAHRAIIKNYDDLMEKFPGAAGIR